MVFLILYQNRSPNTWCQTLRNACHWHYFSRVYDKAANPDLVVPKLTKRHPYHRRVYDKGPYHRRNYVNYLSGGYYAFKQFWKHADLIRRSITAKKSKTSPPETYTSKILDFNALEDEDEDEDVVIPSWNLGEITSRQVTQLIKAIRAELFPPKSTQANSYPGHNFYVPEFLLTQ